jgi:hypothetical protein
MSTIRWCIAIPAGLAKEIDELIGPRDRNAFFVACAQREVKRRKLLEFLQRD